MVSRTRGISTVMDIALALLLISASVLLIGTFLAADEESIDDDRGERALQSLMGSTTTITYDVSAPNEDGHAATDSDNFELPKNIDDSDVEELHEITTYGSSTALLSEAALTNLQIEDTELFAYGHDVERSVESGIQGQQVGTEGSVYVVATWEPYDGSSIRGSATVGDPPRSSVDTSTATMEASSPTGAVDPDLLAEQFREGEEGTHDRGGVDDGFDAIGGAIGDQMVEGYFPPEQTQYTLESTLSENAVTLYNYRQMADVAGVEIEDEITESPPNATEANEVLVGDFGDAGMGAVIAEDLRDSDAGDRIQATYDEMDQEDVSESERDEALAQTIEEVVSTGTVDITVQTWE